MTGKLLEDVTVILQLAIMQKVEEEEEEESLLSSCLV